jgi:hypothetical protein
MFLIDCGSLSTVESLVQSLEQLEVLFTLLNAPASEDICEQDPAASARKLKKIDGGGL